MAFVSNSVTSLIPQSYASRNGQSTTPFIDSSASNPFKVLLGFSVAWLLLSSVLLLVSLWKLQSPSFLTEFAPLTYGRVYPAQTNAFVYGWSFNSGLAVILWLVARLSKAPVQGGLLLVSAVVFWNIGVALGLLGVFTGDSVSLTLLEMPRYATPVLFVAYSMIAVWAVLTFYAGSSRTIFASQWYVLAALLWFPWLYSVAQVLLVFAPVRGTLQSIVNTWFTHNLFLLWLVPIGLAIIYYLLPKITGKAITGYYLAPLAFWWLALFGSISGPSALIGSPVPAWVQTSGIAGSWMLLVPLFIIAINFLGTICGSFSFLKVSPALRFIVVSIVGFLVVTILSIAFSTRSVAAVLQFTFATGALSQLGHYGFYSMAIFGATYFIVPRLVGREWHSQALINLHLVASLGGTLLLVGGLLAAGLRQGELFSKVEVSFVDIISQTKIFLLVAFFGAVCQFIGHLSFALNLLGVFGIPSQRIIANSRQTSAQEELAR